MPKVQTMAAPVGRSRRTDRYMPSIETTTPMIQPIASRRPMCEEYNIPPTDGTIK
jgi:hypothetical protein